MAEVADSSGSCFAQTLQEPVDPKAGVKKLSVDGITAEEAEAELGGGVSAVRVDEDSDTVTLFARWSAPDGTPEEDAHPHICCSVQDDYESLGGDLWAMRYRMEAVECAELLFAGPEYDFENTTEIKGSRASEPLEFASELRSEPERFASDSESLGERRWVWRWAPEGLASGTEIPVLVLADGGETPNYVSVFEPMVLRGELPPFAIVGLVSGNEALDGELDVERWGEIEDIRQLGLSLPTRPLGGLPPRGPLRRAPRLCLGRGGAGCARPLRFAARPRDRGRQEQWRRVGGPCLCAPPGTRAALHQHESGRGGVCGG